MQAQHPTGLDVLEFSQVDHIAHENFLPLMVDSTFTTLYLMRPFDLGADLIFHSATKFLCGHDLMAEQPDITLESLYKFMRT